MAADPAPRGVVVRTTAGEVTYADAVYFGTSEAGGELEVFRDDLTVIKRYEPGEWRSVHLVGSKL